jgi:hypothetical protein
LGRSSSWSRSQCVSARRRWRQSARRCQNPKHGSSLLPACFSSVDVGVARDGRLNLASALIKIRCRVVTERKKIVILVARVTHRLDAPRPQAARTCQRRRTHRRGNWQDNDRRGEANQGRRGVGSATAHTTSFLSRVLGPGPAVSALAASQPTLRCPPVPHDTPRSQESWVAVRSHAEAVGVGQQTQAVVAFPGGRHRNPSGGFGHPAGCAADRTRTERSVDARVAPCRLPGTEALNLAVSPLWR